MLDGILGRGFSVKCKSLVKAIRARIDVVRRRADAKQRFLKEDLAKLLSNGLDINAYGRTEEFLSGMNLLSSYDFIEQSCEYIVKQLSRMQKQGECPEECRQAVASLMFAAARFSDLPELRDLRDTFQQRYGNCLEAFVNQKFVEKLSSRPPAVEKRLQVLQDIASEFSIKWDSKGFEQRMATPTIVAQVDVQKADVVKQRPGLMDERNRIRNCGEGNLLKRDEPDNHISRRKEILEYREKSLLKREESSSRGDNDIPFRGRHKSTENKHSYPIEKGDATWQVERASSSSNGKVLDNIHFGHMRHNDGISNPKKGEIPEALFREKAEFGSSRVEHLGKTENVVSYNYPNKDRTLNSIRKRPEEESDGLKSCSNYNLPPPYVKSKDSIARPPPYTKPVEDKCRNDRGSKHAGSDMDVHSIDTASRNRSNVVKVPDLHLDLDKQLVEAAKAQNYGHEKELEYKNEIIPLPKPRSIRRKHHKSSSSNNVAAGTCEDVSAVNKSRRRDHSRNGLRILFDEDEHHRRDDDERIIDKLLIHYSKKPSNYDDAGKSRQKLPPGQQPPRHRKNTDIGESSLDGKCEEIPHPTRSVSLPHDQIGSPESKKVMTRSNTFQPDNQSRHVHPKLPDYDDLAARFAALKGR